MKSFIFLSIVLATTTSFADHYDNKTILDCRATKMVEYFFEEGFSADEYPDVEVAVAKDGSYSVQIGSTTAYEKSEGDSITLAPSTKDDGTVVTVLTNYKEVITIEVERRSTLAIGRVKVKETTNSRARTIAHIVCQTGFIK